MEGAVDGAAVVGAGAGRGLEVVTGVRCVGAAVATVAGSSGLGSVVLVVGSVRSGGVINRSVAEDVDDRRVVLTESATVEDVVDRLIATTSLSGTGDALEPTVRAIVKPKRMAAVPRIASMPADGRARRLPCTPDLSLRQSTGGDGRAFWGRGCRERARPITLWSPFRAFSAAMQPTQQQEEGETLSDAAHRRAERALLIVVFALIRPLRRGAVLLSGLALSATFLNAPAQASPPAPLRQSISAGAATARVVPAGVIVNRTDVAASVERLYRAYFGRIPRSEGIRFWLDAVANGTSLAAVSQQFASSPEFRDAYGSLNDSAFVDLVYERVLGRSGDASGRRFWVGELAAGRATRGSVMLGFSEAPEYRAAVGHLDGGEVDRLYRAFFRRSPDSQGRSHWLAQRAGGVSLGAIANEFSASPEFRETYGALSDEAFVELVYRNVLGRSPDSGGRTHWAGELASGRLSRGEVMVGFSESPEFGAPVVHPDRDLGGCTLFPANSFWNRKISDLPVHPDSDRYVRAVGSDQFVHPNFGSGLWQGHIIGFPWIAVDGEEIPPVDVDFRYDNESDPGPYPIRWDAPIEVNRDHHVLTLDRSTCTLHELFGVEWQPDGTIHAGSGARYDLTSNDLRPLDWTSADAAGLAMLPGMIRYPEVASGRIDHAIRITVADVGPGYVWPARHGSRVDKTNPNGPPYGTRLRLKSTVDLSQFTGQALVIATAMREYGVIVADIGGPWHLSGEPDERWNNAELRQLRQIVGNDLEAVDASSLMIDPDSGEVRQ